MFINFPELDVIIVKKGSSPTCKNFKMNKLTMCFHDEVSHKSLEPKTVITSKWLQTHDIACDLLPF